MEITKLQRHLTNNNKTVKFTDVNISKNVPLLTEDYSRQVENNIKPCDVISYLKTYKFAEMVGDSKGDKRGVNAFPYRVCLANCDLTKSILTKNRNPVIAGIKVVPFISKDLGTPSIPVGIEELIRKQSNLLDRLLEMKLDGTINTDYDPKSKDIMKKIERYILHNAYAGANIEARVLNCFSLLNEGEIPRVSPHVVHSFMDFNCMAHNVLPKKVLDKMLGRNHRPINERYYSKEIEAYSKAIETKKDTTFYYPFVKVIMTEWVEYGTLKSFLEKLPTFLRRDDITWYGPGKFKNLDTAIDLCLKVIIFQVFYTLACIQKHLKGFVHNDLHFENILVGQAKVGGFTKYTLDEVDYCLPNLGFDVKIWDFDMSSSSRLQNGKIHDVMNIERNNKTATSFLKYLKEKLIKIERKNDTIANDEELRIYKYKIKEYYNKASKIDPEIMKKSLSSYQLKGKKKWISKLHDTYIILKDFCYVHSDSSQCTSLNAFRIEGNGFSDVQKFFIFMMKKHSTLIKRSTRELINKNNIVSVDSELITKFGSYRGTQQPGMFTAADFIAHNSKDNSKSVSEMEEKKSITGYFTLFRVSTAAESKFFVEGDIITRSFVDTTTSSLEKMAKALAIRNTTVANGSFDSGYYTETLERTLHSIRDGSIEISNNRCVIT